MTKGCSSSAASPAAGADDSVADFDPGPEMPAVVDNDDIPFIVDVESTWPGHLIVDGKEHQANARKIPMTSYNYADLTLPASHWEGIPYINSEFYPERTPTPLVCGGTSLTPFYWPVAIGGVKTSAHHRPDRRGQKLNAQCLGLRLSRYSRVTHRVARPRL